jgi:hypothetical protein
MQKLTKDELLSYQTTNNMVLVKPSLGEQKITLPDGTELKIDAQFEKEVHAPCSATVVAVPSILIHSSENVVGMEWETEMELRVGDFVVYNYLSAMAALDHNDSLSFVCEKELYFLVPYYQIFACKRDNQIIPINGYCLVSPINSKDSIWEINESASTVIGCVAHVSKSLIKQYLDGDGLPDTDNIQVGDIVSFDIAADLPVQYPLHATLDEKTIYYRMQRRYINGIIEKQL